MDGRGVGGWVGTGGHGGPFLQGGGINHKGHKGAQGREGKEILDRIYRIDGIGIGIGRGMSAMPGWMHDVILKFAKGGA